MAVNAEFGGFYFWHGEAIPADLSLLAMPDGVTQQAREVAPVHKSTAQLTLFLGDLSQVESAVRPFLTGLL